MFTLSHKSKSEFAGIQHKSSYHLPKKQDFSSAVNKATKYFRDSTSDLLFTRVLLNEAKAQSSLRDFKDDKARHFFVEKSLSSFLKTEAQQLADDASDLSIALAQNISGNDLQQSVQLLTDEFATMEEKLAQHLIDEEVLLTLNHEDDKSDEEDYAPSLLLRNVCQSPYRALHDVNSVDVELVVQLARLNLAANDDFAIARERHRLLEDSSEFHFHSDDDEVVDIAIDIFPDNSTDTATQNLQERCKFVDETRIGHENPSANGDDCKVIQSQSTSSTRHESIYHDQPYHD